MNCLDIKKFESKDGSLVSHSRNQERYTSTLIVTRGLSKATEGALPTALGTAA